MNLEQKRLLLVLDRIKERVIKNPEDAEAWGESLNDMLDELEGVDFFGIEGQNDPRGDQRNGLWTMGRVEGLDPR